MKKRIEIKEIKKQDTILAFDTSNFLNLDDLNKTLKVFNQIVKDYDTNVTIILFNDQIQMVFPINNCYELEDYILPKSDFSDFNNLFKYIKEEIEPESHKIFKVFVITNEIKQSVEKTDLPVSWVSNIDLEIPFGELIKC